MLQAVGTSLRIERHRVVVATSKCGRLRETGWQLRPKVSPVQVAAGMVEDAAMVVGGPGVSRNCSRRSPSPKVL